MKSGHSSYALATSPLPTDPPNPPSPRAMSSAVSSNRLSLCGHTSSCTVPLSSRQAFAKDVALLTPTERAKCPIWRCKLLSATVSASTSPMRPTPGRRTENSENTWKITWIYTSLYRENDDSLEKKTRYAIFRQMEVPSAPVRWMRLSMVQDWISNHSQRQETRVFVCFLEGTLAKCPMLEFWDMTLICTQFYPNSRSAMLKWIKPTQLL